MAIERTKVCSRTRNHQFMRPVDIFATVFYLICFSASNVMSTLERILEIWSFSSSIVVKRSETILFVSVGAGPPVLDLRATLLRGSSAFSRISTLKPCSLGLKPANSIAAVSSSGKFGLWPDAAILPTIR